MKNVSSVFGNNKSCSGWGQDIVFFVVLFFCSTYVFFQLIGTLIKVWSTRMDCKHGLMISSRLCNWVWMQSELYERSMIYVWLTLVWTFPLGSEPFFPFAYVLISWPSGDFTFFLQRFKWPTLGQWKPVPTRDSYFSFNWACFNLFSSQTPDVQHSCNCWRRGLCFTVIHVILMWFIWLPEVRQIPHFFYLLFIVRTCTEGWPWILHFRYACLHST